MARKLTLIDAWGRELAPGTGAHTAFIPSAEWGLRVRASVAWLWTRGGSGAWQA